MQSVPALPRTRYGCSGTLGHPPTTIRIGGRRFKHPVLVKDGLFSVRGVVHLSLNGPSWVSGAEVLHIPTAIHRSLCTTPCRQVLQTAFSRGHPSRSQPRLRKSRCTCVETCRPRPPETGNWQPPTCDLRLSVRAPRGSTNRVRSGLFRRSHLRSRGPSGPPRSGKSGKNDSPSVEKIDH